MTRVASLTLVLDIFKNQSSIDLHRGNWNLQRYGFFFVFLWNEIWHNKIAMSQKFFSFTRNYIVWNKITLFDSYYV